MALQQSGKLGASTYSNKLSVKAPAPSKAASTQVIKKKKLGGTVTPTFSSTKEMSFGKLK